MIRKNWIISAFDINKRDLFNPANYIYNEDFHGLQYKLILDRNIFSFIISASLKSKPKQIYRDAIALIVFCQMANIMIEPNMAVYEKINFNTSNAEEAVEELILFYRIDNTASDNLMSYAIGFSNEISPPHMNKWNSEEIKGQLTKHEWLKEWKSLYLIVLNLVYIADQEDSNQDKLKRFIAWMVKDFRLSLVSIVHAIFLFSSIRKKNMVKFRRGDTVSNRQQQINNMTWDLFFMNNFFRKWVGKNEKEEFLVATDDKLVKEVLEKAIFIQANEDIRAINKYLHPNEVEIIEAVLDTINNTQNRTYNSDKWSYEYRDKLIKEMEKVLLN